MPTLRHRGRDLPVAPGETVLDVLLRAGVAVPNSCRAGACRSCLQRAVAGAPPAAAQVGLRDGEKLRGCFLACVCRPEVDLALADEDEPQVDAEVVDVAALAGDVVRVRLAAALAYRAGQFVTLQRGDGLARSYSLASVPELGEPLELHVRVLPGGRMSQWIARDLRPGERVRLRGPAGDCFYVAGRPEQPLALIGTGTGLAPLYGLARDALRHGHTGPITLLHGAPTRAGLYLEDVLEDMSRAHANLRYVRCALRGDPAPDLELGAIEAVAERLLPRLAGHRVFLCGDPERVRLLRKQSFLRGARSQEILADAFVTAPPPAST
jgi:NAD(P)H-flavin reductase